MLNPDTRPVLDMMMFWGNEEYMINDVGPNAVETERIGAAQEEVANFRADSFRDVADDQRLQHVMHNMSGSEDMEMQEVDVTWTKNGDDPRNIDIIYAGDHKNGLAAVNSMSLDVPQGFGGRGTTNGSIEEELANAMGSYDSNGRPKKKIKKRPPIQHSTEWAY